MRLIKNKLLKYWGFMLFKNIFSSLIVISILAIGCTPTKIVKVEYNNPTKNTIIDTLYIGTVAFGPFDKAILPLLDAAIFNRKTDALSSEILKIQNENINEIQKYLVDKLTSAELPFKVFGPEDLNAEKFTSYKVTQPLLLDDSNFPVVQFGENNINLFEKNGNDYKYEIELNKDPNLSDRLGRQKLQENLKKVGIKYFLVMYNRLSTTGVGFFGMDAALRLESDIIIYNQSGFIVTKGTLISKYFRTSGDNILDYRKAATDYVEIIDEFVLKIKQNIN